MRAAKAKARAALYATGNPKKLVALNGVVSCLIHRSVLQTNINNSVDSKTVLGLRTCEVTEE